MENKFLPKWRVVKVKKTKLIQELISIRGYKAIALDSERVGRGSDDPVLTHEISMKGILACEDRFSKDAKNSLECNTPKRLEIVSLEITILRG